MKALYAGAKGENPMRSEAFIQAQSLVVSRGGTLEHSGTYWTRKNPATFGLYVKSAPQDFDMLVVPSARFGKGTANLITSFLRNRKKVAQYTNGKLIAVTGVVTYQATDWKFGFGAKT